MVSNKQLLNYIKKYVRGIVAYICMWGYIMTGVIVGEGMISFFIFISLSVICGCVATKNLYEVFKK